MANWEYNAKTDLKEYAQIKTSLITIPMEIDALEKEVQSIRSVTYDKTPVQGGTSGREDALIDNIDRRERLKINLEVAKNRVKRIEQGLSGLSDNERKILERSFTLQGYWPTERQRIDMGYSERQFYRIKYDALKKFTLSMFGVVDL